MQQRIPRTEVEQVHSLVSEVVKEVLAVDGLPDADRLHCRVTGSYIRGKPMTGSTCCSHILAVSPWMQYRREAAHAANKSSTRSGLCRLLYAHTQLHEQLAYCCISHQASTEGSLVQVKHDFAQMQVKHDFGLSCKRWRCMIKPCYAQQTIEVVAHAVTRRGRFTTILQQHPVKLGVL